MIELGDVAKDSITGFMGVVNCEYKWLHGCRRLQLQPQKLKDGKPVEAQTFDEPQLILIKKAKKKVTNEFKSPEEVPFAVRGGDRPNPTHRKEPK